MNIVPKKAPKWQPKTAKKEEEQPPVNENITVEVKEVATKTPKIDISKDNSDDDLDTKVDSNIFNKVKPPSPKGKKKKVLSEKQRAHLAKIRAKSLAARRAKAAEKKEQKAKSMKEQREKKAAETQRRREALAMEKKRINLERKAKDEIRKNERLKKQQLKNQNLLAVLDHWYERKQAKKKARKAKEKEEVKKAKAQPAQAQEPVRQYQGRYSAFGGSNQQPLRTRRSRMNAFGYREYY